MNLTILGALDYVTLFVHVIVCILLIGIVLIQGGKGASMSASFGMGAATSAFGARTDSFMTKLTAGAAITFVVTSLGLTFLSARTGSLSQQIEVTQPVSTPVVEPTDVPSAAPGTTESAAAPAATSAPSAPATESPAAR